MMNGSFVRATRLGSGAALAVLMAVAVSPNVRVHASTSSPMNAVSAQARSSAPVVKADFDPQDDLASPDMAHRW